MKTIAAEAGVTAATVSLCLANNPRIPAGTRERVQAIARRLRYQPNPYISTLMRIRRQGRPLREQPAVALVCAQRTEDGWRLHAAPTIRHMREGALERAGLRGYRAEEIWLHRDGMSNDRFSAMLHARGIQGVLISPLAEGDPAPSLTWGHFSAVCLSVPLPSLAVTTVCNDHYFSAVRIVRECHRRGYRRPGLVLHRDHRFRFQGRWEAGFWAGSELLPGLKRVPPLYVDDWTDPAPIVGWLRRAKPDVVITPSAEVLRPALAAARCRVPDDLGLALLACPAADDPHSGVFQNGRLIGELAMDTLLGFVERHERGLPAQATTLMVEGQWNEGQTLRPAAPGP